ncbi:hypothetical protein PROVALCAL_03303 [Providencia alcalifaciens DSM 30120]|uniref:Uncharacterized protein n=1 Tax=Providencia alcalifaciens DSM 30120 TaxID=520999 RepID=B6XIV4_9GAMM|nr:hypothetical protein PROVALCAL_03303 [Providencia alcalifaciens DSM 30120]
MTNQTSSLSIGLTTGYVARLFCFCAIFIFENAMQLTKWQHLNELNE